jgi:hypothetical protein
MNIGPIDVDAYRQVVDRLLRSQHLNAVFSIELQALTNYPQKQLGRSFLLNAHALAWTDDSAFRPEKAAKAMSASPALWSEFGAETVRSADQPQQALVQIYRATPFIYDSSNG